MRKLLFKDAVDLCFRRPPLELTALVSHLALRLHTDAIVAVTVLLPATMRNAASGRHGEALQDEHEQEEIG